MSSVPPTSSTMHDTPSSSWVPQAGRKRPRLSIITPVSGDCPTVLANLQAVAGQTGTNVEHVVVDCGCDDSTYDWIYAFRDRITVVPGSPQDGYGMAYNRGLAQASGEIIGFLAGDETYAHTRVLETVSLAMMPPRVDAVYGDMLGVVPEDTCHVKRALISGPYSPSGVAWGWAPPLSATFIRRDWCRQVLGMSTELRVAAAYDYLVRMMANPEFRLDYLNQPLVRKRLRFDWRGALPRCLLQPVEEWRVLRRHGLGGVGSLAWKNLLRLNHLL